MQLKSFISVLSLTLCLSGTLEAKTITHPLRLPFDHISVAEGEKIQGDYHFAAHQIILCKEAKNSHAASIEWKYNGVTYKKMLPATLKDDKRYNGEWANSGGTILITNEHGHDDIQVSCEYRNID